MHLHFERNINAKCDCSILSLSWMGKVPDEIPEEEGWKLNRTNYYQEGWLATGNVRGIVGVTFTTSHCKRSVDMPLRTNYNLRGHRSDVILVKWNEPYQKLASCDSSGVIFVWIKYEGRWSIELINDRSTPVTHFSWSHDGRMALICYQDGFVLVGSVAGQRYWSSMLTLEARITSGCWTPDDAHVYLGTASAHLVVMDVHGAMISQVQLTSEDGVTSMAWSCEKFKMEEGEDENSSLNGSSATTTATRTHILAVALVSGGIVLMRGYDDVAPIRISTGLDGKTLAMEWANSQELLAVAGALLQDTKNGSSETNETTTYRNVVKFYSDSGILLYTVNIPYTQCAVSSLTWGHAGRRLFVATGGAVHVARVWRRVAPLALLARVAAAAALPAAQAAARLPLPPPLRPLIASLFANTIRCCVPEPSALRQFVSRPPGPPARLHCTMLRHDDDESANGGSATNGSNSHGGSGGGGGSYTLYLEHLGGLVPLLKGKRTSKIRPEFVIFDPQCEGYPENRSSTESSSSSSSGSSSTSRSSNSGYNVPRSFTTPSDSSDTERDEGCSGSPRLQRRRKARRRQQRTTALQGNLVNGERQRALSDREHPDSEDLTYIDSLPEDIRLVEVTSNIWGTKFKIHGLAKNVPANLGQVTYKTSLLHLQPRQMTLVITELRDDFPVGPDPNFNPNIFSEDEEDVFQTPTLTPSTPVHKADPNQNERQRVPRPNSPVPQSLMNSHIELPININNNLIPALARAESYEEEFPYVDLSEMMNFCENLRSNGNANIIQNPVAALERRSTSNQSRHAISPLRCDGSVPTLQSPKNAVAPSDIIFERPSPQTVSCGGVTEFYGRRGEFCAARNDHQHNLQQIKNSLATIDQSSVSYDVTRQVTIKRPDQHLSESIAKRVMSINKADTIVEVMISNNKNTSSKGFKQDEKYNNILNTGKRKDDPSLKITPKCDDLKFIDEEVPTDTYPLTNLTERTNITAVERTTVVPISPACSTAPVIDTMIRSCSVGYLDLVDPQLITGDVTLAMLRKETPKRLILVNRKTRNNARKTGRRTANQKCFMLEETTKEPQKDGLNKTPILNKCGKSKSLDSSDVFTVSDSVLGKLPTLPASIEESTKPQEQNDYEVIVNLSTNLKNVALNKNEPKTPKKYKKGSKSSVAKDVTKLSFFTASKTPQLGRKSRQEYPECSKCKCVTPSASELPLDLDLNGENTHTCSACLSIEASCNSKANVTPGSSRSHRERSRTLTDPRKSDKDSDSDFASSLEQLLWRLRGTEGKGSESRRMETGERSPPVASAPASPRLPRSSPASPALASKRSKRNSSASPIRQILNSPLLNRRRYKSKPPESSDDELIQPRPIESIVNSRNYRDLESFQKAQLRQKLKRGKIEPTPSNSGGPAASWPRRQLVMHNKAPMWNENSQVYQLDFGGRVTQESAKNFQIEYRGKQVMQFGRIDGNAYTLDFQYPFSALQAFAVALANVTQRLK